MRRRGANLKLSSHRLNIGTALSSSLLRISTIRSRESRTLVASADSRCASVCLARSEAHAPLAYSTSASTRKTLAKTTTRSSSILQPLGPSVHFQRVLKQVMGQENACNFQFFQEFRANMGRLERAHHLAIGTHAFAVELEYLLHADHVLVHAHNLRDVGHLAAAVAHSGDLHDRSALRRDLLVHS